jgi:two-component system CheB/CheR fusion protein
MHGGTIGASSAGAGKGSEFTLRLPVSKEDVVPIERKSERDAHAERPARRVLVVDDNVDAALTISALLKAWGHEVQTAFNGPSALEMVNSFQPEVILLDLGLPGMSGYDVARRLRAAPFSEGLVIAAVTGYGQEEDRRRSFEAGFDYHVTKPPDPGILETLIASSSSFGKRPLPTGENN